MKVDGQPRKVYNFLKKNMNTPYCDDCLGTKTEVDRHHVNTIAATPSLFPKEFSRRHGVCRHCGSARDKLLTMAV